VRSSSGDSSVFRSYAWRAAHTAFHVRIVEKCGNGPIPPLGIVDAIQSGDTAKPEAAACRRITSALRSPLIHRATKSAKTAPSLPAVSHFLIHPARPTREMVGFSDAAFLVTKGHIHHFRIGVKTGILDARLGDSGARAGGAQGSHSQGRG
jgi:hypothetical protein